MSLTGSLFLGLVVAVTVAAFTLVVVLWPRLTGPSPWRVAGRVAALGIVNLLVLLTAATQLNAAYLFYAGWGDLTASVSGHVAQTGLDRGTTASTALSKTVTGTASVRANQVPTLSSPVGANGVATFKVHGLRSGLVGKVLVQLPRGYAAPGATTRYPVLEAFHGYPSEPLNWVKIFHIGQAIQQQVDAHHLRPTIVVMPQIEFPAGVDTEGVNGPGSSPQVETWLTQDVPDWVAHTFRTAAGRSSWSTIGYSAGGWNAAMATVLHPAQYGAGIILGGYFHPEFGPFYEPFAPRSRRAARYDLARVVRRRPPPVALWVETSHADALSYGSSARFLHAVRPPTAVHAVVLQNAGHRDSVWVGLLPQALTWLGANVAGFAP